jgi:hypothetical protein
MKKLFLSFLLTSLVTLAGGSSAASGEGEKFSCTLTFGTVASCSIYSNYSNSVSAAGAQKACLASNQTVGTTCPTKDLLGCCTTKNAGGVVSENCFYKGGFTNTQAGCTKSSGTWSANP